MYRRTHWECLLSRSRLMLDFYRIVLQLSCLEQSQIARTHRESHRRVCCLLSSLDREAQKGGLESPLSQV